ncbi:hypothetical protein GCM10009657_41330 [Oryzihumus leptocrescens]
MLSGMGVRIYLMLTLGALAAAGATLGSLLDGDWAQMAIAFLALVVLVSVLVLAATKRVPRAGGEGRPARHARP